MLLYCSIIKVSCNPDFASLTLAGSDFTFSYIDKIIQNLSSSGVMMLPEHVELVRRVMWLCRLNLICIATLILVYIYSMFRDEPILLLFSSTFLSSNFFLTYYAQYFAQSLAKHLAT